jgi:parallel beta-helix repeat protein
MKRRLHPLSPRTVMHMCLATMLLASAGCDAVTPPEEAEVVAIGVQGSSTSADLTVQPGALEIEVSEVRDLVALDASGNPVKANWSSSNTSVATITNQGRLTGMGGGSAVITARSRNRSATADVTVKAAEPPPTSSPTIASVTITPSSATIEVGATVQLVATARDANGNTLAATFAWASSNTAVATVTSSGLTSGVAGGSATVTATADGKSGSSAITVNAPAPSTSPNWGAVITGVRPRGFGAGTYALLQPASNGATYYVATNGNDSNPGSSTQPFRTINKAAQVAIAGDVVMIRNGTYQESVFVRNSGTASRRIVFQAENRGGVVLTGGQYVFQPFGWVGETGKTGPAYVTVKGLIFRRYSDQATAGSNAVRTGLGWHVEDVLFDESAHTGLNVRDHGAEVRRTSFIDHNVHAFLVGTADSGTGPSDPNFRPLTGFQLIDVIMRGNHTTATPVTGASGTHGSKIALTRGAVIDNVESTANLSSGIWLDSKNTDFVIRNSYFHGNRNFTMPDGRTAFVGRGLYLEKNWSGGLVENNVFMNNEEAGIVIVNTEKLQIRNNLFARNKQCLIMYNMNGHSGYVGFVFGGIHILNNHCKDWETPAGIHTPGGPGTPADNDVFADGNTYEPVRNAQLAWWPNGIGVATTIAQLQQKYGWEWSGRIGTSSW